MGINHDNRLTRVWMQSMIKPNEQSQFYTFSYSIMHNANYTIGNKIGSATYNWSYDQDPKWHVR